MIYFHLETQIQDIKCVLLNFQQGPSELVHALISVLLISNIIIDKRIYNMYIREGVKKNLFSLGDISNFFGQNIVLSRSFYFLVILDHSKYVEKNQGATNLVERGGGG